MTVEWVSVHWIEELLAFREQRWHPVRIALVDIPLEVNEFCALSGAFNGCNN
jgi:hypothetical protein